MILLQLLGSVELRAETGEQLTAVVRQPKRLALLLYLALNPPIFHRRDRLLALFWPDLDEERARRAMSQAVFQLRAAIGKDRLVNRGDDEIGLQSGALRTDVVEFERLLDDGRLEDAMAIYHGEIAPSFVLPDCNDFQDWLDERRSRVCARACEACLRLAELATEPAHAVRWARRALEIDRLSEAAYQRLIVGLDQSGDRAAALQAFDELRELLEREFESEPSAETQEIVRAVRERGEARAPFRLVSAQRLQAKQKRRILIGMFSLLLIVAAVFWSALIARRPQKYQPPANRIAVLYFNDQSPAHDLQYLAEGLTSTLIDQLGQVDQIQIISQNGVRPFRGDTLPLDSIARQLDVGTLVGGSVTQSGGRYRVNVEMVDGATGVVLRSRTVERPRAELFALLDDISNEVSAFLRSTVGHEIKLREWRAETKNVEAWRMLQQAEQMLGESQERDRAGSLEDGWSLLARADSFAQRALELDSRFVAATVLRGTVAERRTFLSFQMDTPPRPTYWLDQADEFAQQALLIDANHPAAHELRGAAQYWRWLITAPATGDTLMPAAERHLRRAIQLAGERPRSESVLSGLLQSRGDYSGARVAALRALQADAYLMDADQIVNRLFETSFQVGDDADAGRWCEEVRRRFTGHWPSAWCDLVLLGWSTEGGHDPRKAAHLLETFGPDDPVPLRAMMRPRLQMLAAAVSARAGRSAEADSLLKEARAASPLDVELLALEAAARILMKDQKRAQDLLREYLAKNPGARPRILNNRMYQGQTIIPLT